MLETSKKHSGPRYPAILGFSVRTCLAASPLSVTSPERTLWPNTHKHTLMYCARLTQLWMMDVCVARWCCHLLRHETDRWEGLQFIELRAHPSLLLTYTVYALLIPGWIECAV